MHMSVNFELKNTFIPEKMFSVWLIAGVLSIVGIASRNMQRENRRHSKAVSGN